jgi:hypothetical protein
MTDAAVVGQAPRIVDVQAVALYDTRGRIHHTHHVIVLEGTRADEPKALKREAIAQAENIGHDVSKLKSLHVTEIPDWQGMYRVDPKRRVLVELEPPKGRQVGRRPPQKVARR